MAIIFLDLSKIFSYDMSCTAKAKKGVDLIKELNKKL